MTTLADIQRHVGVTPDGQWGPQTASAIAKALGMDPDTPEPHKAPSGLQIGPQGIALVQRFEGCARKRPDGLIEAYPDPGSGGDPWTIGWGTTGADVRPGTVWTQAQCDARFERDLDGFAAKVAQAIGDVPTGQAQFDAMVSLAYNIGTGAFGKSTLLKLHLAGDYAGAERQFGRWNRAAGRVMAGLTRRRADEAALYGGRV